MFGNKFCCNKQGYGIMEQPRLMMETEVIEPTITKCVE